MLALDIGGTKLAAALVDPADGTITLLGSRTYVTASDAMKERASAPGGCWKLPSIRLHQV